MAAEPPPGHKLWRHLEFGASVGQCLSARLANFLTVATEWGPAGDPRPKQRGFWQ